LLSRLGASTLRYRSFSTSYALLRIFGHGCNRPSPILFWMWRRRASTLLHRQSCGVLTSLTPRYGPGRQRLGRKDDNQPVHAAGVNISVRGGNDVRSPEWIRDSPLSRFLLLVSTSCRRLVSSINPRCKESLESAFSYAPRKQIENGSVSSVHQAAAACNVSRPAVQRWLSRGLLPEPPWTLKQLHQVPI